MAVKHQQDVPVGTEPTPGQGDCIAPTARVVAVPSLDVPAIGEGGRVEIEGDFQRFLLRTEQSVDHILGVEIGHDDQ
jgi:hypothetical protein